ncbi:MAG: hypothetical protein M1834_006485 [Cirrosporium novae-zelandiae]|nr:MAG: hypothetical protein M1834_006485 [Cirrosporium novae-zelandiae]
MASTMYVPPPRPSPLQPSSIDRPLPPPNNYYNHSAQPTISTMLHPPTSPPKPVPPVPVSMKMDGKVHTLHVVQQPIRARMCGFGDKTVYNGIPNNGIAYDKLSSEVDVTYGVLTVDLWNENGTEEVNLVRHSPTDPSISNVSTTSYPPPPPTPPGHNTNYAYLTSAQPAPPPPYAYSGTPQQPYQPAYYQAPQQPSYYPSQPYSQPPMAASSYPTPYMQRSPLHADHPVPREAIPNPNLAQLMTPPTGMFSRNLIGSLSVSAQKLTDTDGKMGVWFVLQDLSVRTEGTFRLKMSFVNVANPHNKSQLITAGSAPILASAFSEPFQVFSAKKFPGVIESTNLSKCFATQGIKIPIRKDAGGGNKRRQGDDEDSPADK